MATRTQATAEPVDTGYRKIEIRDLLQAGVHFGHQTHRWNPKMRKYIFAERGGIYLIDLKKTLAELERAQELARQTVLAGRHILYVCTKPQLKEIVQQEAERCGAFYVTERWLGGMLTNFQTIKKNIARLKELERGAEEGHFEYYTKKEQLLLERERQKLERYLSGIKEMSRLPGMVYVVDAKKEEIAVKEAHRLEIPMVAIADTNADPDMLTVPIAGNDDAIRSVSLITRAITDAIELARREAPAVGDEEEEEEAYTYSSDAAPEEEERPRRKRRRSRPRRRPRPEVIAKRLQKEEGEGEAVEAEEAEEAPAGSDRPVKAGVGKADAMEADPSAEAEVAKQDTEAATKPAEEDAPPQAKRKGGALPTGEATQTGPVEEEPAPAPEAAAAEVEERKAVAGLAEEADEGESEAGEDAEGKAAEGKASASRGRKKKATSRKKKSQAAPGSGTDREADEEEEASAEEEVLASAEASAGGGGEEERESGS